MLMSENPELNPLDKLIGDNARARRKELGLSQEQMADILGCESTSMVSMLERGQRTWRTKWIYKFCSHFKIEPAELFGGIVVSAHEARILNALRRESELAERENNVKSKIKAVRKDKESP